MSRPDLDRVTDLLHQVGAEVILPRFRNLSGSDIESKPSVGDPNDIVTIVDRLTEEWLTRELAKLAPGVPVVGEESTHANPDLLRLVDESDAPVWVLDPIDGTKNFARGDDAFGVMLAWVERGQTTASWIVMPARAETVVAEAGSGAWRNGERLRVPADSRTEPYFGVLYVSYMPDAVAAAVADSARGRYAPAQLADCAAVEYTDVAAGAKDFAVYHRLYPWDHAPGALILTEAGGCVVHADGTPYTARARERITVVAGNAIIAGSVCAWLRS
ncbi:MAG TPA: inositol monophosphatase [Longimicrobiales bacterium]|nr:inositol monophosphatase [Longimicrobiales bacterium]